MPTIRANYNEYPLGRNYTSAEPTVIDYNYQLYSSVEEGLNQVEQGKVRPMREVMESIREKIK